MTDFLHGAPPVEDLHLDDHDKHMTFARTFDQVFVRIEHTFGTVATHLTRDEVERLHAWLTDWLETP